MSRVRLELARASDEADIRAFLDAHWRKGHVFVTDPELMRWQHEDATAGRLNFLLARREEDGALLGLLGYIPMARFHDRAQWSETALAIWKVREDAFAPGLGIQMLKWLQRETAPDLLFAIGLSDMVVPMYRALGFRTGTMEHWALFPEQEREQRVASGVPAIAFAPLPAQAGVGLRPLGPDSPAEMIDAVDVLGQACMPRKSWAYVMARYLSHPWYPYDVQGIVVDGALRGVIVWRKVAAPGGALLRIVDMIGDEAAFARCGPALRTVLAQEGADYIDIVQHGIADDALRDCGFIQRDEHDGLVLPNYFAPFVASNVDVTFAYKLRAPMESPVRLLRGDSDQDRPNSAAELAGKQDG